RSLRRVFRRPDEPTTNAEETGQGPPGEPTGAVGPTGRGLHRDRPAPPGRARTRPARRTAALHRASGPDPSRRRRRPRQHPVRGRGRTGNTDRVPRGPRALCRVRCPGPGAAGFTGRRAGPRRTDASLLHQATMAGPWARPCLVFGTFVGPSGGGDRAARRPGRVV